MMLHLPCSVEQDDSLILDIVFSSHKCHLGPLELSSCGTMHAIHIAHPSYHHILPHLGLQVNKQVV
jgi:hypothetical protein